MIYGARVHSPHLGTIGFEMPLPSECPLKEGDCEVYPHLFHVGWSETPIRTDRVPSISFGERIPDSLLTFFPDPLKVYPLKEGKRIPSQLTEFTKAPFLCVSDQARKVIEVLDPGIHQFIPARFVDRDSGKRVLGERDYFFFNILTYVRLPDLFDLGRPNRCVHTESTMCANGRTIVYVRVYASRAHIDGLAIRSKAFHGRNIVTTSNYLDRSAKPEHAYVNLGTYDFFMTEAARRAFNKERLNGLRSQLLPESGTA